MAPHSGQSSQLFLEAIDGSAQFLARGTRSGQSASDPHSEQSANPLAHDPSSREKLLQLYLV
jgi:hypothetical protein